VLVALTCRQKYKEFVNKFRSFFREIEK
jgi:hypothetical protein